MTTNPLTTGFTWHVFPIRCRDVARGITPLFQDTPFRVRHSTEPHVPSSHNPGACCLLNDAQNGLLIVTDTPVPPKLPDGWTHQRVRLDDGWAVCTEQYTARLIDRVATADGDLCTFEATAHGEDE